MDEKIMKVMVIEDEEMLLRAIVRKLESSGFETLPCTNAKQAIDCLKGGEEKPDVIWLDYYLPDMDGLDFMHQLKSSKEWSSIPVVVVSNSASEEKRSAMLALGTKKYVLKAKHRLEDIVSMIKGVVEGETI